MASSFSTVMAAKLGIVGEYALLLKGEEKCLVWKDKLDILKLMKQDLLTV